VVGHKKNQLALCLASWLVTAIYWKLNTSITKGMIIAVFVLSYFYFAYLKITH